MKPKIVFTHKKVTEEDVKNDPVRYENVDLNKEFITKDGGNEGKGTYFLGRLEIALDMAKLYCITEKAFNSKSSSDEMYKKETIAQSAWACVEGAKNELDKWLAKEKKKIYNKPPTKEEK